jgi:hypothetical protein
VQRFFLLPFKEKELVKLVPYAGGGVGLSYNRIGLMTFLFPITG